MNKFIFLFLAFTFLPSTYQIAQGTLESQLDKLYEQEFQSNEPGGALLVKKGNEIIFSKSYGLADLKTKNRINEHTIFNTGSISKTLVANGILILRERGLLSLDDPISKYFDDFDVPELSDKVTIKHLLSHTSGLPDIRNVSQNRKFFLTAKDKENWEPIKRATKFRFEPGSQFEYSNPAFNGLALIIEQVSGLPWQQFIRENIFQPAGMTESKITNGPHPETGVAHAYVLSSDNNNQRDYEESDYGEVPTFAAAGNGGVWCSVLDLAKYEQAMKEHLFLSEQTIKESRTVYHPKNWSGRGAPQIGYSWFTGEERLIGESGRFDVDFVFHTGSQGGFRAFHITVPEKELLFVGLFNRPISDFRQLIKESLTLMEAHNWLD